MKELIDELFPVMSEQEQKEMLRQVCKEADKISASLAQEDPISKHPMA